MGSKSMEIKVMYCQDLKAFNFFQKLLVYVLVSLVSDNPEKKLKHNQQQRTPTDTEDDGNPDWNHEMKFDLDEVSFIDCDHVFVHFDLRHEGLYFGDKTIGDVRVPIKDLIQESSGITRFLKYQVRDPDGKPNGMLNFSCKVNAQGKDMGVHFPAIEITGYSTVVHHHHESAGIQHRTSEADKQSSGVYYPAVESEDNTEETSSAAPVSYPSQGTQQESPYPPTTYAYYPQLPPPPPPPLYLLHHPPPPPFLQGPPPPPQGAHHHLPCLPGLHPWGHGEVYDYGAHGNWSSTSGYPESFSHGETWRYDYRAYPNGR